MDVGSLPNHRRAQKRQSTMAVEQFSPNQMRKASWGPDDYVMDSAAFHEYELKQEQKRQNLMVADGRTIDIKWSCGGIAPMG